MDNLTNPGVVRGLMERHGVRFSKKLGQNFIVNPGVCPRIAELGGAGSGVGAIEIGPGIGVLTAELAKRCDKVVAVELDRRLLPVLAETLAPFSNVKVLHADVLAVDLRALIRNEFPGLPVVVCANLPYYITSPVVMKLLEDRLPVRSITVMVQKEAAQRICAPMPSRLAGAVTAAIRYYAEPELLFEVSPGSFLPPPEVKSAVIRLRPRGEPPVSVADEALLFRVIRLAFAQRRKTVLNGLRAGFFADRETLEKRLREAGVDPGARAEQLSLADFAGIAGAVGDLAARGTQLP